MTVQEIINLAIEGELRNLGGQKDVVSLLGYLNLGMLELYKRFPLSAEEYLFDRITTESIYQLPSNVMWITSAYGSIVDGEDTILSNLPINEENSSISVNSISWDKVQLGIDIAPKQVSLMYIASPPSYTEVGLGGNIALPPQLTEALLSYMSYRAHSSVVSADGKESNVHYRRFEASCKRVEVTGMITSDDMAMYKRLYNRGFV